MAYISLLWIFFGALVSLNAVDIWTARCTDVTIDATLKSEIFLPCRLNSSISNDTVKWSHYSSGEALLRILRDGTIYFDSPREGRVTVFPLLFQAGNFSILIHDLKPSDIGTYICELSNECWKVKITAPEPPNQKAETGDRETEGSKSWLFFLAGAGVFTLLFITFKCTGLLNWTEKCMRSSKSRSDNEEHCEEHDSSYQTLQPQEFTIQDPNGPTTSTVYEDTTL